MAGNDDTTIQADQKQMSNAETPNPAQILHRSIGLGHLPLGVSTGFGIWVFVIYHWLTINNR